MTKRDTFARVELDSAGSLVVRCGEVDHVFWDSDKGYLQRAAELINAAHDKAVREAVAERDDRIAELDECMRQAGLQCFIPNGKPEEISKHMESVSKSWIEEKKKSEDRISELDRVLENTLQSLCVLCDFIEVEYPRNFDEEEHTLFLEDIDNMKVKIKSVLGKGANP